MVLKEGREDTMIMLILVSMGTPTSLLAYKQI
jgi:hypothetical protein